MMSRSSSSSPPFNAQSPPQSPARQRSSRREQRLQRQLLAEAVAVVPPSQHILPEAALGAPLQQQPLEFVASQQQQPPAGVATGAPALVPAPPFQSPSPLEHQSQCLPQTTPRPSIVQLTPQMQERMHKYQRERQDELKYFVLNAPMPYFCFESDATTILQELAQISTAIGRENSLLRDLMSLLRRIIVRTQVAAKCFMIQRHRLLCQNVLDRDSIFVHTTVATYQTNLRESCDTTRVLLEMVREDDPTITSANVLQAISTISSHLRDFMTYVVLEVERNRQLIQPMVKVFLDERCCRSNPQSASRLATSTPQAQAPSFSSASSALPFSMGGSSAARGSASLDAKNKSSSSKQQGR